MREILLLKRDLRDIPLRARDIRDTPLLMRGVRDLSPSGRYKRSLYVGWIFEIAILFQRVG